MSQEHRMKLRPRDGPDSHPEARENAQTHQQQGAAEGHQSQDSKMSKKCPVVSPKQTYINTGEGNPNQTGPTSAEVTKVTAK